MIPVAYRKEGCPWKPWDYVRHQASRLYKITFLSGCNYGFTFLIPYEGDTTTPESIEACVIVFDNGKVYRPGKGFLGKINQQYINIVTADCKKLGYLQ